MAGEMNNTFDTNVPKFVTKNGDNILFPFSPPIFQSLVDDNFVADLISVGRKNQIDFRNNLAGNMKTGTSLHYEYDEFFDKAQNYLLKFVHRFITGLNEKFGNDDLTSPLINQQYMRQKKYDETHCFLDSLWINFQQKNDFNPPHTHSGDLSFVIYCKVEDKIFKEQAISNTQQAGNIVFSHGESMNLTGTEYPVQPYKNLILIFPAKLKHFVPPYWIDSERITVSGNFVFMGTNK